MSDHPSIDSAIAHQVELEKMLTPLLTKVDQQAQQIIEDVDVYLETLRKELLEKIQQNNKVRLE